MDELAEDLVDLELNDFEQVHGVPSVGVGGFWSSTSTSELRRSLLHGVATVSG